MSVAKRAHAYPQVRVAASDLTDVVLATARGSITVGAALALLRKRDATLLATGGRYVLREDLSRASLLGLDEQPAASVARDVPVVTARAGEAAVRRLLAAGAPLVVVRGPTLPLGAVAGRALGQDLGVSAAARVARCLPAATRALLATIGRVAAAEGARAFLVGGLVRDVWCETPVSPRDLDLVVEGHGLAVARRLARELGGLLVEHPRFLTASVDTAHDGRIDVATARTERYETRGALPRVLPASIEEDLKRRDFTVNAMAIELHSGAWGLLDPFGGRVHLARGHLSVLHPLSYVEDPTRMFRAARYATRLGLGPDRATVAAQALALGLVPYPALSGQRIVHELGLAVTEERPESVLAKLGTTGVLRLIDPRYRFTAATRARVRGIAEALAWARLRGLQVGAADLTVLALLAEQPRPVALAGFERLAFAGEPLACLTRCLDGGAALARRLAAGAPSVRASALRGRAPLELAWLYLVGGADTRATLDWYLGLDRDLPSLSGDDVVALGVPRGPAVARVLAELRDGRLDGRLTDRGTEVAHVQHWLTRGG